MTLAPRHVAYLEEALRLLLVPWVRIWALLLVLSGCAAGANNEIDAARDQAKEDFGCDEVEAGLESPGYVAVSGCSQRATYACAHTRSGWLCRRMY